MDIVLIRTRHLPLLLLLPLKLLLLLQQALQLHKLPRFSHPRMPIYRLPQPKQSLEQ